MKQIKRFSALALAALVLLSCCTVFAFAADSDSVDYSAGISNAIVPQSIIYNAGSSLGSISPSNFTVSNPPMLLLGKWSLTLNDSVYSSYAIKNKWYGFAMKVTPESAYPYLDSLDYSKYEVVITWNTNSDTGSTSSGLTDSNLSALLSAFEGTGYTYLLPQIGTYHPTSPSIVRDGNKISQEIVLNPQNEDEMNVINTVLGSSTYNLHLPFFALGTGTYCSFEYHVVVREKTTYSGGYDLGVPDKYNFGIPMNFGFTSATNPNSVSYTVTDSYPVFNEAGLRTGYSFRDYAGYYKFVSFPFMRDNYGAFFSVARKEQSELNDVNAWHNSALDTFTFSVPYTLSVPDGFDLDKQKTEFLFRYRIAGQDAQLQWYPLRNLAMELQRSYYDFEAFSINVGGMKIGFDYFDFKYFNDSYSLEATLRLSSEDETQKMFIKKLLENNSFQLTFSVAPDMHGAWIGLPYAGFLLGDAISPVVPGSDGKYSQADIDAAFNRGYNSGLSDGSDKNYVFGFVNGTWSAFTDFYSTVTNGISIGGIRLSAIITSVCIVAILVFVLKKVI